MFRPTLRQLILILSLLIILEVFWLDLRLEKLKKQSPDYLKLKQEKAIEEKLRQVPEPSIEEGFLLPSEASLSSQKANE